MQHNMGIIGFGGMAGWHLENSKRVDGLTVVAAYDIDGARLEAAKEKGLKAYQTLEDFLADDSFDLVLVATPNNFHKTMSMAAMQAKKHVICEKPVAMNSAELAEMMQAAKDNSVLFTVHQNRRWDTDYKIIRKVIQDGMIGKPYTIESRVHGQNGMVQGWREYKVAGGGMMLDWGVHMIDQMLDMVDQKVTQVYAHMFSVNTPEVDDYFKLLLRFESGLSAQIEVGTYCLQQLHRWYVNGDKGSAVIEGWDCKGKIIQANQYAMEWEPVIVQTAAGPTRTMAPRPKETLAELPLPEEKGDWTCFYHNVLKAIDGREELIVKPEQCMRVMKIMEAAFASNETGHSIVAEI